jgi:glycosyltransferase involved in cell wall biosynthesis
VRRIPIAHVVLPAAKSLRPAPEFVLEAAQKLKETRGLDLELLMPVPFTWLLPQPVGRGQRLIEALRALEPRPTLLPYVPLPRRSIESATAALATHLVTRPRVRRPSLLHGSFLDGGGFVATTVARVLEVPSIAVAHGTDTRVLEPGALTDRGRPRRSKSTLAHATHVLAVSHELAHRIARFGRTAEVVRYSADEANFPLAPRPTGPARLLFVGRLSRDKGLDILLDAMTRLTDRDVGLDLVGGAVAGFDVKAEIGARGLGSRIVVHGELERARLPEFYARASALVLPSRAEGLPCVVVESLLVGRPVITSAVGGLPELVDDSVGALVPSNTPEALARAVESVLARAAAGELEPGRLRTRAVPFTFGPAITRLRELSFELAGG